MTTPAEEDNLHIRFVSLLLHDLETPLAVARHFIQRVESGRFDPADPRHTRLMQSASRAIDRAERILEDTLETARAGTGRLRAAPEPVAVRPLLDECVQVVLPMAEDKGIRFRQTLQPAVPETLRLDPLLTARVLDNYLVNAIRHAPLDTEIRLQVQTRGNATRFAVLNAMEDGFEASTLDGIFDPVRQIEARWKRRLRGSGIGLTFCRQAIEAQQGAVGAQVHKDGTAEFWFELPGVPSIETRDHDSIDVQGDPHGQTG